MDHLKQLPLNRRTLHVKEGMPRDVQDLWALVSVSGHVWLHPEGPHAFTTAPQALQALPCCPNTIIMLLFLRFSQPLYPFYVEWASVSSWAGRFSISLTHG